MGYDDKRIMPCLLALPADPTNFWNSWPAPAPQSVDLVVAIWMHLPPELRAQVHTRAIAALRPGGPLILEAYTPRQLAFGTGGPPMEALLIEPEQLRLELLVLEERERWISEGPYHHGQSAVVRALGQKPAQ